MAVESVIVTGYLPTSDSSYTDFTSSGFGTPEAAIVLVSASSSGTNPAAQILDSVGFWTPAAEAACGYSAADAVASSNTAEVFAGGACAVISNFDGNALIFSGSGSTSGVTDGLRITKTGGTTGISRFCTVILLKGLVDAYVGQVILSSTGSSSDVVGPGFKPDLVFFGGNFSQSASYGPHARVSFGAAHNDSSDTVTQGCVAWGDFDAQSTMLVNTTIRNDRCLQQAINNSDSAYASASDFDSFGFTLTYAAGGLNRYTCYLALELPNPDDAYVGIVDSKTSTGTQAYTGTGFTPVMLCLAQTIHTATNTLLSSGDVGAISIGAADGASEACVIFGSEDGTADSNVFSERDESNILHIKFADGTDDAIAALDSFDSDGWTLNYSDGSASARKMLAIAIGDSNPATYQYARPDADVTDGAWLNEAGSATNLYASIDEATADDDDYIYTGSASTCEVSLSALNDPGVGTSHTVRYRAKGDGATDLIVTLKQGSTTIATWTESNAASALTDYSHTLTTGEADSITDYTDLRLRFEAS